MRDLTTRFLSDEDRQQIDAAVKAAEAQTAGEIVVMATTRSYHYSMATLTGSLALSFPAAVALTPVVGEAFWMGPVHMWVFISLMAVLAIAFWGLLTMLPPMKRWFISRREMIEEVEEAATVAFFREGLYRTRDETGLLIYISLYERRVHVLADRGIHARMPDGFWQDRVDGIVEGIRGGKPAPAICEAVAEIGRRMAGALPVRDDDTDELKNVIIS